MVGSGSARGQVRIGAADPEIGEVRDCGARGRDPLLSWHRGYAGATVGRGVTQVVLHFVSERGRPGVSRFERWSYARVVSKLRARWIAGRLPGWLKRLVEIGALSSDPEELRVRKAVLVMSSTLMASLASVWVLTYAVLGLWVSAAIPFVYQLASAASIYTFARTRRYRLFRRSQLWMSLVLPFVLQWSLGGFRNSSAVCLWGFTSPLGALLFVGARQAISWFVAFVGLVALSAAIDPVLAAGAPYIPSRVVIAFFALNILGVASTAYALLQYFVRAREREQARSERLLLNVLPEPVAARLKQNDGIIADAREDVTVLFADIVGSRPCLNGSPPRTSSRCWTACSPVGTRSPPSTVSRRSRQSAMPTWSPAASRYPARITPRRSPTRRSRWPPTSPSWRPRPERCCKCGSGSIPGRSSPA